MSQVARPAWPCNPGSQPFWHSALRKTVSAPKKTVSATQHRKKRFFSLVSAAFTSEQKTLLPFFLVLSVQFLKTPFHHQKTPSLPVCPPTPGWHCEALISSHRKKRRSGPMATVRQEASSYLNNPIGKWAVRRSWSSETASQGFGVCAGYSAARGRIMCSQGPSRSGI